jgi:hypothetical protein
MARKKDGPLLLAVGALAIYFMARAQTRLDAATAFKKAVKVGDSVNFPAHKKLLFSQEQGEWMGPDAANASGALVLTVENEALLGTEGPDAAAYLGPAQVVRFMQPGVYGVSVQDPSISSGAEVEYFEYTVS